MAMSIYVLLLYAKALLRKAPYVLLLISSVVICLTIAHLKDSLAGFKELLPSSYAFFFVSPALLMIIIHTIVTYYYRGACNPAKLFMVHHLPSLRTARGSIYTTLMLLLMFSPWLSSMVFFVAILFPSSISITFIVTLLSTTLVLLFDLTIFKLSVLSATYLLIVLLLNLKIVMQQSWYLALIPLIVFSVEKLVDVANRIPRVLNISVHGQHIQIIHPMLLVLIIALTQVVGSAIFFSPPHIRITLCTPLEFSLSTTYSLLNMSLSFEEELLGFGVISSFAFLIYLSTLITGLVTSTLRYDEAYLWIYLYLNGFGKKWVKKMLMRSTISFILAFAVVSIPFLMINRFSRVEEVLSGSLIISSIALMVSAIYVPRIDDSASLDRYILLLLLVRFLPALVGTILIGTGAHDWINLSDISSLKLALPISIFAVTAVVPISYLWIKVRIAIERGLRLW